MAEKPAPKPPANPFLDAPGLARAIEEAEKLNARIRAYRKDSARANHKMGVDISTVQEKKYYLITPDHQLNGTWVYWLREVVKISRTQAEKHMWIARYVSEEVAAECDTEVLDCWVDMLRRENKPKVADPLSLSFTIATRKKTLAQLTLEEAQTLFGKPAKRRPPRGDGYLSEEEDAQLDPYRDAMTDDQATVTELEGEKYNNRLYLRLVIPLDMADEFFATQARAREGKAPVAPPGKNVIASPTKKPADKSKGGKGKTEKRPR